MLETKLGDLLGSGTNQDVRVDLRNEKFSNKTLKISVAGYNITDKGNITLQAIKNDEIENITLFPEDGYEINTKELDNLINKLVVVSKVNVNKEKDDRDKVISITYRALYLGMENIKVISEYPKAQESGVFNIFYTQEDFLTLRSFEEKEFRVGTSEKTKKPIMRKAYVATMRDMVGTKLELRKVVLMNDNKDQMKSMLGKKIRFIETEQHKNGNEKVYISYDLPEVEGSKKVEAPTPKPESK